MAREFAKAFYASKQWQKCRAAYIAHRRAVDGGMCESCHEVSGYIVHHKIELTPENINNPEITLNFSNLKYDCHLCHNREHGLAGSEPPVPYAFTADGDLVILPPELSRRSGER